MITYTSFCLICNRDTKWIAGTCQVCNVDANRAAELTQPAEDHAAYIAQRLLLLMAATHHCTPEEGYGSDIAWALSDLRRALRGSERTKVLLKALDLLVNRSSDLDQYSDAYYRSEMRAAVAEARVVLAEAEGGPQ